MTWSALGDHLDEVKELRLHDLNRNEITYIDIGAIDRDSKQIAGAQRISVNSAPSRARQEVRACDVLVSTVRPNLNAVAKVPSHLDGEIASTGFCVLRPRLEQIDDSYLFYLVQSSPFIERLIRIANGASYPAVTDDEIRETPLRLPRLPEQRRIAAQLEQADRLRRTRRYTLALSDTFLPATFRRMFGDAFAGSSFERLGELVTITGGGTPAREKPEYYTGRIP
jgi:type I restriction enzyme S subunit